MSYLNAAVIDTDTGVNNAIISKSSKIDEHLFLEISIL